MKRGPKAPHLGLVDATEAADTPTSSTCGGRTKSGGACKNPAGRGTEHPSVGQCRHHDGQVDEGGPCLLPLTDLEARLWDELTADLVALRLEGSAYWAHKYGFVTALAGLHIAKLSAIGTAATVKGSNGAMRKHPSSTVISQMLSQLRQFSNDLGLNPSALAAMGRPTDPKGPRSTMDRLIRGRR